MAKEPPKRRRPNPKTVRITVKVPTPIFATELQKAEKRSARARFYVLDDLDASRAENPETVSYVIKHQIEAIQLTSSEYETTFDPTPETTTIIDETSTGLSAFDVTVDPDRIKDMPTFQIADITITFTSGEQEVYSNITVVIEIVQEDQ